MELFTPHLFLLKPVIVCSALVSFGLRASWGKSLYPPRSTVPFVLRGVWRVTPFPAPSGSGSKHALRQPFTSTVIAYCCSWTLRVCVCDWVRVFPAANFVLFLPDERVVHLELVHIFSHSSAVLLHCYCSVWSCFAGEKKNFCFCQKALFNLLFLFNRIWKSLCLNPSPLSSVSTVNFRRVLMEAQMSFSPSHCCLCVHFNIQPHNHFSALGGKPAIVQKAQILFNIHVDSSCNYGFSFWMTWSLCPCVMLTLLEKATCLVTHTDAVSVHAGCLLAMYGCVFVRIVFVLYVPSYYLGQNYPLGTFEDVLNWK